MAADEWGKMYGIEWNWPTLFKPLAPAVHLPEVLAFGCPEIEKGVWILTTIQTTLIQQIF
jgi:hypothetical protein